MDPRWQTWQMPSVNLAVRPLRAALELASVETSRGNSFLTEGDSCLAAKERKRTKGHATILFLPSLPNPLFSSKHVVSSPPVT